jgi:hypothetical protein
MRIYEELALSLGEAAVEEDDDSIAKYLKVIDVLDTLRIALGSNQDFLGIMKFSGIATNSANDKPFGANVVDDIAEENAIFTGQSDSEDFLIHTMTNTQTAYWYNNDYAANARAQLATIADKSSLTGNQINLVVNGVSVDQTTNVTTFTNDNAIYIYPGNITKKVSGTNYALVNDVYTLYTEDTVVEFEPTDNTDEVNLYSNGAYVGTIQRDGQMFELSALCGALNADYYYNADYNTLMIFLPDSSYGNALGQFYVKAINTNNTTKEFMNTLYEISLNISDENLIKAIAMSATIAYNKQFSTSSYKLYPQGIELNSMNFDVFMKQLFVSDLDLARRAEANSLYNEVASTSGLFGVMFLMFFELMLVVYCILRDSLLSFHSVMLPILFIAYYIFSNRFFYKPWMGTVICFIGVALTNGLTLLLFRIPNAMTAGSGSNNATWAILIGIVVVTLACVIYGYLWYFIFKDIHNLGYVKAKAFLKKGLDKIGGKFKMSKDDKKTVADADGEVVSSRLNAVTQTGTASKLSSLDRYQQDINNSSIISSRIVAEEGTGTAAEYKTHLDNTSRSIDIRDANQGITRIQSTDYGNYAKAGAVTDIQTLNTMNKQTPMRHGKDYEMIGDKAFVTNEDIIKQYNMPQSYTAVAPATQEVLRTLSKQDAIYEVDGDMVRYVSSSAKGFTEDVTYSEDKLTVPKGSEKTVKDYLDSQGMDFDKRANNFTFKKDKLTDAQVKEIEKISKPVEVHTDGEIYTKGYAVGDNKYLVQPDSALNDIKKLDKYTNKVKSSYAKRSVNSMNSMEVNKLFKDKEEVYTYNLKLGSDEMLKPLVNDLYQIANRIEERNARERALTLQTNEGLSVVFESKEDYELFKKDFVKATADYFVRPSVYKDGDTLRVYTLNGDNVEAKRMTQEEFRNSDYSLQNCKKLN